MTNPRVVVIAGGGTGGHVYPAIAIAKALRAKDPSVSVQFIGTPQGMETKIVPKEGFILHQMSIGKLNHGGGLIGKIRTLLGIPRALLQSAALLMELKPEAVLGVGGYASGPFVLVASLLGFRASIWEPNAKPGLTNRWLSRFVRRSFVVFEDARKELRSKEIVPVGLPVRAEVERLAQEKPAAHADFHVLIFGGSQGARTINHVVRDAIVEGDAHHGNVTWRQGIRIVHQTGIHDFPDVRKSYEGIEGVEVVEYLHDMDARYRWADLVVCRAGASTVAELAAARKPAILVPLPWAADDHQRRNAESLVDQKAAVLIPQSELNPDRLIKEILRLKNDSQALGAMREHLERFHKPLAAEKMADLLLHNRDA